MTIQLVIFVLLACVGLDYLVRWYIRRSHAERDRAEREKTLEKAVRMEFRDEAASLRRVELPNPKARILAVDDEKVVLDSLRRILVLEGYSIDTVESGPEALSLMRLHDYDFVFTDLKMPDMNGVEVVKAVKHLRPDVDMVVITGYGTIETAVETMKYGACEYVQKPFSAEELAAHVDQLLVQRLARLQARRQAPPRVTPPSQAEEAFDHDDRVPGGSFIAGSHVWVWIESGGCVRVGIDDLANQALGAVGEVGLPEPGLEVRSGDPLFSFRRGAETLRFPAPVGGKVRDINGSLAGDPSRIARSPYRDGWICRIEPGDLGGDLGRFLIGRAGAEWYVRETDRLQALRRAQPDPAAPLPWPVLAQDFFAGESARV